MIEHAMAEAGRVADLMCAMEMRIAGLKDGDHLLEQTEARLGRLEEVDAETTAQLERKEQLRDELGRELMPLETEVRVVTESARHQMEASKTSRSSGQICARSSAKRSLPSGGQWRRALYSKGPWTRFEGWRRSWPGSPAGFRKLRARPRYVVRPP